MQNRSLAEYVNTVFWVLGPERRVIQGLLIFETFKTAQVASVSVSRRSNSGESTQKGCCFALDNGCAARIGSTNSLRFISTDSHGKI